MESNGPGMAVYEALICSPEPQQRRWILEGAPESPRSDPGVGY